jgi:hypothetical protein
MMPPWRKEDGSNRKPADRGPGSGRPIRRAGLGLFYLAIGRREGFDDFGNTADAYLASLAPLVAFALVSGVLAAASGAVHLAALGFLFSLCAMLAPAVISHPLCRFWGRGENWPRYANILNWGQMLMFLIFSLASAAAKAAVAAGLPAKPVLALMVLAVFGYAVWFQWFVARGAVQVSRGRTVLLLLATMLGTNVLISAPLLVAGDGWQALLK